MFTCPYVCIDYILGTSKFRVVRPTVFCVMCNCLRGRSVTEKTNKMYCDVRVKL
jgi:hypothetical protein